ncbi:MAG: hypothetical protein AB1813_06560, partial [Verrucomicrobiota bacterium]
WSAPAERSDDGALASARRASNFQRPSHRPKRCRAIALPPHSKRGAGHPDAFGVRRQNEVATALWSRLHARRTSNARRIGQSGVALALCHRTPKGLVYFKTPIHFGSHSDIDGT